MKQQYSITTRAVVVQNMNILMCRLIGSNWYFLPGGNVEFEETADEALVREFKEEMGATLAGLQFIGSAENIYIDTQHQVTIHELNVVFRGSIPQGGVISQEDHIEFKWIPVEELKDVDLRPTSLRDAIILWLGNGLNFWTTQK